MKAVPPPNAPFADECIEDARASDPAKLGWMQGFPPPPDRRISRALGHHFSWPQLRWAVSHTHQLGPVAVIQSGAGPISALPQALRDDLDAVPFKSQRDEPLTWGDAFDANYTDGLLVLHKGRVVHERYAGVMKPNGTHACMSVTKSFVGLLALKAVYDGHLEEDKLISHYIPSLKGTGFGSASLGQVMDMTTDMAYDEIYTDPNSGIWQYLRAAGVLPLRAEDQAYAGGLYDYLAELKPQGTHGVAFAYKTINTDMLAWVLQTVLQQSLPDLLSEIFWQPMGMQQDALIQIDQCGNAFGGGGLLTCTRDLARFGQMLAQDGFFNGRQIVPAAVVETIRQGSDPAKFVPAGYTTLPGFSYRAMWWVSGDPHRCFSARGVHGQAIWVDPVAQVVIARHASHRHAGNAMNDSVSQPYYRAIADHLSRHPS